MPILEFESSAAKGPAPKKPLKLVLGAGVLVGALALGSTFAASITLSSDNNVEFGQGFVATTACDSDGITVTPFSTFINSTGAGEHKLTSIRLSGIDSSDGACEGKTFRIRAYGDGPDPLNLFNWTERDINGEFMYEEVYDFVDVTRTATDFLWTSGGTDNVDVINKVNTPITESAFTINLVSIPVDGPPGITRTPLQLTDNVKKITVESRDAFAAAPVSYAVGDTGPRGGIIFYVAETPFACGPTLNEVCQYLEAAPNNWSGRGLTEEDPRITWADEENQSTSVAGALGIAIGTGYANSLAIAGQAGNDASNSAAALALGYRGGGANDWHLPSSEELRELWKIRIEPHNILLFFSYWSSTQNENNPGQAWDSGGDSPAAGGQKYSTTMVRPIRAFSGSLT
jgi:hypothetical protein